MQKFLSIGVVLGRFSGVCYTSEDVTEFYSIKDMSPESLSKAIRQVVTECAPKRKQGAILSACIEWNEGYRPQADICTVCLASFDVDVIYAGRDEWQARIEPRMEYDPSWPTASQIVDSALLDFEERDDRLRYLGFAKAYHVAKHAEHLARRKNLKTGFTVSGARLKKH